jgi:hypothetical protein
MSVSKLKFQFNKEYYSEFVNKLQDLSHISDVIKLKIDGDFILAYSLVASESAVLCLKSYNLSTSKYLIGWDDTQTFDFVISSSSRFCKNLKFFETFDVIKCEIHFKPSYEDREVMHIRAMVISTPAIKGDRLKITLVGSELSRIRDINRSILAARMNPKLTKWSFKLQPDDLTTIKRMSSINSEDRIISINVSDGLVYFSEDGKWDIQVGESSTSNTKVTFAKKYLSNIITESGEIDIKIFETFILVSDKDSTLLLSFETDFNSED